jgi:leader peptidase (prepilin peptidase)/N-methyltransferase
VNSIVTWLLTLPLELRMAIAGLLGVLVGTQVNRGIYRLAWFAREIGPWSAPHSETLPRSGLDRVPLLGWWFLRRESPVHGRGFWIRPLLIELTMGIGFAALYWYEVDRDAIFPSGQFAFIPPGLKTPLTLHLQFLSHLVLISLMMVATFIDLDEQTIPDAITVPGTLLGIGFAIAFPQARPLVNVPSVVAGMGYTAERLHLASGTGRPGISDWPAWLNGAAGLALALACFAAWCVAIVPWTWTTRRGLAMAVRFWLASVVRRPSTIPISIMGVFVSIVIATIWSIGGSRWESLLSSLVGLAVGGGTIWAVRIVGSAALQQEAMGFGDVTLMAMVGSFTGWQPTLIIFFLAPFSAILIAVAQYVVSRRHDIAFGPYLCLASLFWILKSGIIWREYGLPIFSLGWLVPAIAASGLLLMGGLLKLWRLIRDALFPWVPDEEFSSDTGIPRPGAQGESDWGGVLNKSARIQHPLRKRICLQPPQPPIPGKRQLGHRPPNRR